MFWQIFNYLGTILNI
jgi:hypothetical protein